MRPLRALVLAVAVAALTGCGRDADGPASLLGPDPSAPAAVDRDAVAAEPADRDAGRDASAVIPARSIGGHLGDPVRPGGARMVPGKIVVKLEPGESLEDFHLAWGTATELQLAGSAFAQLDLPGEGADPWEYAFEMTASEECEVAEPLYVVESPEAGQGTMPFFEAYATRESVTDQDAMDRIGASAAHGTATGTGVVVAIVDTGIDATHPDLAGRVLPGWDFVDGDADPTDAAAGLDLDGDGLVDEAAGHGTHVGGLVQAVAPGAMLLAVRVLDSEGNGTSVGVARGIRWAAENGADVINLSLGMYSDAGVIKEAVDDALDMGIVVVAAAGNRGVDDRRHFPSRLSHVVAVAATDANDMKADFSNYGSPVRVAAPGVALVSTWLNHGYASWSGTSMATPLVSGAAALRLQLEPLADPSTVADALDDTAAALPSGFVWTDRMGGGRLQILPLLGI